MFDDDVNQLAKYCAGFAGSYDVEGVLVSFASEADSTLRQGFHSRNWDTASVLLEADSNKFNPVKHLVTSHEELRRLLSERKPDFVLSDFQMRHGDTPLTGVDVMRIASETVPDAPRAIHTGAGFAREIPVKRMNSYDKEDRAHIIKAMREYGFKVFPKPRWDQVFDPTPIEAHFSATGGRSLG